MNMDKRTEIIIAGCLVLANLLFAIVALVYILSVPPRYGKEKDGDRPNNSLNMNEEELKDFFAKQFDTERSEMQTKLKTTEWDYQMNPESSTKRKAWVSALEEYNSFCRKYWDEYFEHLKPDDYEDKENQKQIKLGRLDTARGSLNEEDLKEYTDVKEELMVAFKSSKVCPYKKSNCNQRKDGLDYWKIQEALSASTDYEEQLHLWTEWSLVKKEQKDRYIRLLELDNEIAKAAGFENKAEMWKSKLDDMDEEYVNELWETVRPLYDELHTYVGKRLMEVYGDQLNDSEGYLPAHVFGSLYANKWSHIGGLVRPFPNVGALIEIDEKVAERYKSPDLLEYAEDFYELFFSSLPDSDNVVHKESDMDCSPSAWDFGDGKTYRFKICAQVTLEDLIEINKLMGQLIYFSKYAKQPFLLRTSPLPGFVQGVGGGTSLIVLTPDHLDYMDEKLLKHPNDSYEASVNLLMDLALSTVVFLPFAIAVDKWRWDVFSEEISEDEWYSRWWEYRKSYQRIKPPVKSKRFNFNPGGLYEIIADKPLIDGFFAGILQFQVFKGLCLEYGSFKEESLHKCSFSKHEEIGEKLSKGMALGASKAWQDVLTEMIGDERLDATPLVEYFDPLYTFLRKENRKGADF